MSDKTGIEWTDATWNPITGCTVVSAGCTNCYAMRLAGTRLKHEPSRKGLTKEVNGNHVWTGEVRFNEHILPQPLRWTRPRRIFVCAHGDLFHESVPFEWIDRVFAVMALTPHHTYQVLTKRPDRMREYMQDRSRKLARFMVDEYIVKASDKPPRNKRAVNVSWPVASVGDIDLPDDIIMKNWPLPNVWLGVSIEDQATAEARISELLETPAAVRWVSAEPLLGPVNLLPYLFILTHEDYEILDSHCENCPPTLEYHDPLTTPIGDIATPRLDWVVVGGESGPKARPMHPEWARTIRDHCKDAEVPFFFKQWGEWSGHSISETGQISPPIDMAAFKNLGGFKRWDGDKALPVNTKGPAAAAFGPGHVSVRIGKSVAGDLLDGAQHQNWPAGHTQ